MLDIFIATSGRMVDVLTYYQSEAGDSSAVDAGFERRLLDAVEKTKSESLTLEQIKSLKLDRSHDDGRGALIHLLADRCLDPSLGRLAMSISPPERKFVAARDETRVPMPPFDGS
jgi:hypothetical protein